jgi:hypothetical protein
VGSFNKGLLKYCHGNGSIKEGRFCRDCCYQNCCCGCCFRNYVVVVFGENVVVVGVFGFAVVKTRCHGNWITDVTPWRIGVPRMR